MVSISKDVWSPLARKVGKFVIKHAPQLAGYVGVGGFLVAIGLTYKNAADIHEAVETKDYKSVAKKALPIAAVAVGSTVAIHYSCRESEKRLAAALLANNISTAAYTDLRDSLEETISKKKIEEVDQKADEKKVVEAVSRVTDWDRLERIGTGQVLCYEHLTGRLFLGDAVTIERAVNDANAMFDSGEELVKLGDLHWCMGFTNPSKIDDLICWHRDYNRVKIEWGTMELQDHTPVAVIRYRKYGILDPYCEFKLMD